MAMQSVGQGVTVPIASASPVALTFATPNDVAWWAVAALTGCHRLGTVLRGWPANQVAISTRKLRDVWGTYRPRAWFRLGMSAPRGSILCELVSAVLGIVCIRVREQPGWKVGS